MPLTLAQIAEQVGKKELAYVADAPFHYIVLNKPEFTFNMDRTNQYIELLDQIEATKGPGVLVTIGLGKRHFCTGFDLPYWMADYDNNMKPSIYRF